MVLGDVTLQLLSWQNDSCRDWVEWALSLSLSIYIYNENWKLYFGGKSANLLTKKKCKLYLIWLPSLHFTKSLVWDCK